MKNAIYTSPGQFTAAGLLFLLLVVACETPLEQRETFGHVVTWRINQDLFVQTTDHTEREEILERIQEFKKRLEVFRTAKKEQ